jgi:hypothetical protein
MKKIAIITLAILLVSTISGCLGGGAGTPQDSVGQGYPGVEFIQFYPINNYVPEKSDASFYYAIQNNGYFDAENVQVMLYNCGDIKDGTHTWADGDLTYNCNTYVPGGNNNPKDGLTLKMPDRIQGVTGEVADAEVSLSTDNANLPVGESPHTVSARVRYNYQTTAIRDVVFTTFNNWKEKGGAIETGLLMSSSKPAPIEVSINAPDNAIIITEKTNKDDKPMDQAQEFTIAVQIRNTGGGFLKDKSLNYVELCYDPMLVDVADPKDFITCKDLFNADGTEKPGAINDAGNSWDICCDKIQYKAYDTIEPNCLCVPVTDNKLSLVGLTNQWRDVSAVFKTAMDTSVGGNPLKAAVKVQDISNFGSTVEYTYMTDTSTQLTLLGQ